MEDRQEWEACWARSRRQREGKGRPGRDAVETPAAWLVIAPSHAPRPGCAALLAFGAARAG